MKTKILLQTFNLNPQHLDQRKRERNIQESLLDQIPVMKYLTRNPSKVTLKMKTMMMRKVRNAKKLKKQLSAVSLCFLCRFFTVSLYFLKKFLWVSL